jgi:hypothetical protein
MQKSIKEALLSLPLSQAEQNDIFVQLGVSTNEKESVEQVKIVQEKVYNLMIAAKQPSFSNELNKGIKEDVFTEQELYFLVFSGAKTMYEISLHKKMAEDPMDMFGRLLERMGGLRSRE